MKYIVVRAGIKETKVEIPFIFPNMLTHAQIAEVCEHHLVMDYDAHTVQTVSAGFLRFSANGVVCSGESESLGISSRDQLDSNLINLHDYSHGIL